MKLYTAVALHQFNRGVLMVKKNHGPEAVRGRWNFIGGKVEDGEKPLSGARREFHEEAGLKLPLHWLRLRLVLEASEGQVYFFLAEGRADDAIFRDYVAPEWNDAGEAIRWQSSPSSIPLDHGQPVPNLYWIWPLMLDCNVAGPVYVRQTAAGAA